MLRTYRSTSTKTENRLNRHRQTVLRACVLGVAFCAWIPLPGQSPTKPSDDTDMFEMFLRYHHAVAQQLTEEQAKPTAQASKDQLAASAAAIFRVAPSDFSIVTPVYEQLKAKLDALDAEGISYVSTVLKNGQTPDIKVLKGFEQRRGELVRAAISELKSHLSISGWQSLCEYINRDFAPQVKRGLLK